ncbi:hypothetical protein P4S72_16045, partial [Vibrio sp. PP-XX7]
SCRFRCLTVFAFIVKRFRVFVRRFIWHNLPSSFTIFGALSIALSGLFIVWRDGKNKTGKQKLVQAAGELAEMIGSRDDRFTEMECHFYRYFP